MEHHVHSTLARNSHKRDTFTQPLVQPQYAYHYRFLKRERTHTKALDAQPGDLEMEIFDG